jgi:hypothetical protein
MFKKKTVLMGGKTESKALPRIQASEFCNIMCAQLKQLVIVGLAS